MTPAFSHLLSRRYVGLIIVAWFALFFLSVIGASGVLRPMAFGMASSVSGTFLPHDQGGRTNVLLLGVGDKDHAGANLTDSIIIASIEPRTRSIVLLSLPRDLYLTDVPGMPDARINAFYANRKSSLMRAGQTQSGASKMAMQETADVLGSKLGVTIHGVIKVDFTAFSEIIDAFGGIDLDVPQALVDYTYPVEEGVMGTFSLGAGPQHLDGDTALKYARSRHSTSDFDRSSRQQQILGALLEKIKAKNPLENFGLARSVLGVMENHAEWTFSSGDLVALVGAVLTVPRENILSMHLSTSVGTDYSMAEAGGFVVSPKEESAAGAILLPYSLSGKISDWGQIRTLTALLFTQRQLYAAQPTITITADPKTRLAAHRLRNELLRNGFLVTEKIESMSDIANPQITSSSQSATSDFLSKYLALPHVISGPIEDVSVHIVLPKDYRFIPLEKTPDLVK